MASNRKKVLVVTSRFPYPLEKGDKLRLYHHLKGLSQAYHVHLVAISNTHVSPKHRQHLSHMVERITILPIPLFTRLLSVFFGFLQGEPAQINYFFSRSAKRKIDQIINGEEYDFIYSHLARTHKYVQAYASSTVVDLMDAFSEIAHVRSQSKSENILGRWFWRREAKLMTKLEQSIMKTYADCIVISDAEKERLPPSSKSQVYVVPNGVDTINLIPRSDQRQSYDIIFAGNLGYNPNHEAVKYLLNELVPELVIHKPKLSILIAGANAPKSLLHRQHPNVVIKGWVDDIREVYWSGRLMVVPIFLGSGMQNKVLEALACGTPVITTARVKDSFQQLHDILISCETKAAFVTEIMRLLDDEKSRHELEELGTKAVKQYFSWEISNQRLLDHLNDISPIKRSYAK